MGDNLNPWPLDPLAPRPLDLDAALGLMDDERCRLLACGLAELAQAVAADACAAGIEKYDSLQRFWSAAEHGDWRTACRAGMEFIQGGETGPRTKDRL